MARRRKYWTVARKKAIRAKVFQVVGVGLPALVAVGVLINVGAAVLDLISGPPKLEDGFTVEGVVQARYSNGRRDYRKSLMKLAGHPQQMVLPQSFLQENDQALSEGSYLYIVLSDEARQGPGWSPRKYHQPLYIEGTRQILYRYDDFLGNRSSRLWGLVGIFVGISGFFLILWLMIKGHILKGGRFSFGRKKRRPRR